MHIVIINVTVMTILIRGKYAKQYFPWNGYYTGELFNGECNSFDAIYSCLLDNAHA